MEPATNYNAVGAAKAKSLFIQLKAYVTSLEFLEVVICLGGVLIPYFLVKSKLTVNQRPIPYQQIQTGDIILDLTFNQPMVKETVDGSYI